VLLELRRRAERALVAVVAECYVRGVSTRRVEGLVQTQGAVVLRACLVGVYCGMLP
jgi:transposase-like protein